MDFTFGEKRRGRGEDREREKDSKGYVIETDRRRIRHLNAY